MRGVPTRSAKERSYPMIVHLDRDEVSAFPAAGITLRGKEQKPSSARPAALPGAATGRHSGFAVGRWIRAIALLAAVVTALSVAGPSVGAETARSAQLHMMRCAKQAFPDANPHASFCISLLLQEGKTYATGHGWVGPDSAAKHPGCLATHWKGTIVPPPYGILVGGGWWCRAGTGQRGQLRFTVHKGTALDPLTPGAYLGLGHVTFKSPTRVDPASLKSVLNADRPLAQLAFALYLDV